jgi:hypothetical protein
MGIFERFLGKGRTPILSFMCFSIAILLVGCNKPGSISESRSDSPKSNIAELKYLVLDGSPYNRGLVHGKTLKNEIREVVDRWNADIAKSSGMDSDTFIKKFIADTDFITAMKKWTPGLLEEVKGISDGSEIDFNTILTYNVCDEVWHYIDENISDKCSGIGISKRGNKPSYVAQNMDLERFRNGFQVLLHIKYENSDLECFVFTSAGLIGVNGMNNKSIGVCVNYLDQVTNSKEGLPCGFVERGILERTTLEDAAKFIKTVKHASAENYILGGPESVYDFEASSTKVVEYVPPPGVQVIYHTNHPLANDDYNERYLKYFQKYGRDFDTNISSYFRLSSLEMRLRKAEELDIERIKSVLSAHDSVEYPVCLHYDEAKPYFTFGCTIMVLSESPELHIAPGPPDVTPFQIFRF